MRSSKIAWPPVMLAAAMAGACGTAPPTPPAPKPAPEAREPEVGAEKSLEELGRELIEALSRGQTDGFHARFDDTMKGAVPADQLAALWPSLEAQGGQLIGLERVRTEEKDGLTAVIVTAAFERLKLDLRVVFTPDRQITGFFVQPAKLDHAYRAPDYADAGAFSEREVTVGEGAWALPATLTLPKKDGKHPVVVLVHGSGPNDRDETLGPNKPFRDLAHGLATRGVAVLRYDKRTLVHGKQVVAKIGAALTLREETIDDALAAAALLRETPEIDPTRIYVLGHSLGGTAVPRIAKSDSKLAGFVILAGSTLPLADTMLRQTRYIAELDGELGPDEEKALADLEAKVKRVNALREGDDSTDLLLGAGAAYWLDLARHDPVALAAAERRPMLVLQGDRDYQVTLDDYARWEKALGKKKNATLKRYAALNHLFIAGEGKSTPGEYQEPGNVAPEVVADIAAFINGAP
jgi:uncharacterized protein